MGSPSRTSDRFDFAKLVNPVFLVRKFHPQRQRSTGPVRPRVPGVVRFYRRCNQQRWPSPLGPRAHCVASSSRTGAWLGESFNMPAFDFFTYQSRLKNSLLSTSCKRTRPVYPSLNTRNRPTISMRMTPLSKRSIVTSIFFLIYVAS